MKLSGVTTIIALGLNLFSISASAYTMNDVYDKVGPSVYELFAIDKDKQTIIALGSSVAITPHYLATNCHVALAGYFLIVNVNGNPHLARLCYFNKDNDLCIVDVVGVELKPVEIRSSKTVTVGEEVYAIGKLGDNKRHITQGKVTKMLSDEGYPIIVSNAQTIRGSSGGGLFDRDAKLIGVTSSGIPGTDIGYAISTELIFEVIDPSKLPSCKLPP
jgi:serine protease Do